MPTRLPFDSSPQVASGLALLFIIVLSAAVGWMTLSASADIVQHIQTSPLVDIEARQVHTGTNVNR
jgi:hypothetical protein